MSTSTNFQNARAEIDGRQLTITVDLDHDLGPSKSMKSTLIATTGGNKSLNGAGDVKIGLTVYRPRS